MLLGTHSNLCGAFERTGESIGPKVSRRVRKNVSKLVTVLSCERQERVEA